MRARWSSPSLPRAGFAAAADSYAGSPLPPVPTTGSLHAGPVLRGPGFFAGLAPVHSFEELVENGSHAFLVIVPLLAAGFTESPPSQPDPSLAAQASFARSDGAEFVLIGVLDRDGVRTMTLGGTVKP